QLGVYSLRIVTAATSAGDFELLDPQGKLVGIGHVAAAFNQGGFSFTLATGATSFVVNDTFAITVSGTEKYKLVDATAVDGSQVAKAVYIADNAGNSGDVAIALNTDTAVLALTRGPAVVSANALSYAATVNTTPLKNALYAQLKALGIIVETTI
ncbi:MAG: head decoration protein, partial [Pseudomonadota bacterium]|nr:head decoration protein [Pseudomonadota bacterium]